MRSSVAGVLDVHGGLRFVVTEKHRFKHHLRPGDLLLIVPGFKVKEPVPWNDVPALIDRVTRYVNWWIDTRNDPLVLITPQIMNYLLRKRRGHPHSS